MSETYIGTTERAAIIRAELKAKHKWTSRDVSVKADHFSMGSAIRIRIKNPAVPLAAVREIAGSHEKIDRDDSGDILSGANRYLDISYSSEAREAMAATKLPAVTAAAEVLAASENAGYLFPVEGSDFLLGYGRHGKAYGFSLWRNGGHEAEVGDLKEAAVVVAMGGRRS
jgi:hypothetical protein